MRTLATNGRHQAQIEAVLGQFHERVCVATVATAHVISACAPSQRFERGPDGRPPDGIEPTVQKPIAFVAGAYLETAVFDILGLLREERRGVSGVAHLSAVVSEASERMGQSLGQEGLFVECRRRRRLPERLRRAGEERQMREPDVPCSHCVQALREDGRLLADADRLPGGGPGHAAFGAEPLDRANATLPLLLWGGRESGREPREVHLEQV